MPGLGEATFNLSSEALYAVLIGNTRAEDTDTFKEIVRFRQWLRSLPKDAMLMDIRSQAEGKSGFRVVFAGLDLPQTYTLPFILKVGAAHDPEHEHQQQQQLEQ